MEYDSAASSKSIRPPSRDELSKLHLEIQMWMQQSGHRLELHEQRPVWKMYNSSLTFATGSGWGALVGATKMFPGKGPMYLIVPASAAFLGVFRVSQWFQLPSLYTHLLASDSPLGVNARSILTALRSGDSRQPLPSEVWAKSRQEKMQQAQQQRQQQTQPPPAPFSYLPESDQQQFGGASSQLSGTPEGGLSQQPTWDTTVNPSDGARPSWDMPAQQPTWSTSNTQDALWGDDSSEDPFATQASSKPSSQAPQQPRGTMTWEEIRAKHR